MKKGTITSLGIILLSIAILFVLLGLFIYLAAKYDFNWLEGFLPRKYQPELVTKEKIAIIDAYNDLFKIFYDYKGGEGGCIINFNLPDLKKYKIEFSEENDKLYIKLEGEHSDIRTMEGLRSCVVAGIIDGEMIAINFYDNWLDDLKCDPNYKIKLSEEEKVNILSRLSEEEKVCLEKNKNLKKGEVRRFPLLIKKLWWDLECAKCVDRCDYYRSENLCNLDPCGIGCIWEKSKCVDSKECVKDYNGVTSITIRDKKISYDSKSGLRNDLLYKADGEHICFIPTKRWAGGGPLSCGADDDRLDNNCIGKIKEEILECGDVCPDKTNKVEDYEKEIEKLLDEHKNKEAISAYEEFKICLPDKELELSEGESRKLLNIAVEVAKRENTAKAYNLVLSLIDSILTKYPNIKDKDEIEKLRVDARPYSNWEEKILASLPEEQRKCLEENEERIKKGEKPQVYWFDKKGCDECAKKCENYANENYCNLDPCNLNCVGGYRKDVYRGCMQCPDKAECSDYVNEKYCWMDPCELNCIWKDGGCKEE